MKKETLMCQLFNFSVATYYKRKREDNSAIKFVEKYFSNEEIFELIETGSIKKLEKLNFIEKEREVLTNIIKKFNLFQKVFLLIIIEKFKSQTIHTNINHFILDYGLEKLIGYNEEESDPSIGSKEFVKISAIQNIYPEALKTIQIVLTLSELATNILLSETEELLVLEKPFQSTPKDIISLISLSNGEKEGNTFLQT